MMWTHRLLRLDDRCPGLYNLLLTGCVDVVSSVDTSSSSVVDRELGDADAGGRGYVIDVPVYSILG